MKGRGVLIITDPNASREIEKETFTCCHCGRVGLVGKHDGGMCLHERMLICLDPACHGECKSLRKRLGL